ncbi:Uncharacterised protein [Shigella sonnei]|nr:Uncharacterised protein [Shigella sonnei]CSS44266.1 Uncharacterised protein [Shigella sonnei]
MQRTINELASVHRQFAFLCLPVIFTEGHVAQAEIEVGHRPVRTLQTSIDHFQATNLQRRDRA